MEIVFHNCLIQIRRKRGEKCQLILHKTIFRNKLSTLFLYKTVLIAGSDACRVVIFSDLGSYVLKYRKYILNNSSLK